MASLCFYFQVHQPYRLRRYSVFDTEPLYFDDERNLRILRQVAHKCYLPAGRLILDLVRRHQGRFRVAFSLTGMVVEQLQAHVPEALEVFQALARSGAVEFLGETYHHSLAFLYSPEEFQAQVEMHHQLMQELLGQAPRVFRNTELIYSNALAQRISRWDRYRGLLAEGADHVLRGRSPARPYWPDGQRDLRLLLKNYRLSDDIAFRFSNRGWSGWPLTAEKFTRAVDHAASEGPLCNLFMDFETFGEHQWAETGIFNFLEKLPERLLEAGHTFQTPSECLAAFEPADVYDVPQITSWADTERDLSAWVDNAMQANALRELYQLEGTVKASGDEQLLTDWRRLTSSDHFYYMCTKYFADGEVHKYFNPYESPYDSYINFMNVLDNLRSRVGVAQP